MKGRQRVIKPTTTKRLYESEREWRTRVMNESTRRDRCDEMR